MSTNTLTGRVLLPTPAAIEAALTLETIPITGTYLRGEWEVAFTSVSLNPSISTEIMPTNHTTTEITLQPTPGDQETAALLTSIRGEDNYSRAELLAAIALVELQAGEVKALTGCGEDTRRIPAIESGDGDVSNGTPARRVTRAMGVRCTPKGVYDMSYHPIDDVISVRAGDGRNSR